jgi:hypothetical protein
MPRYYFAVDGLPCDSDSVGEELEGDEAAWKEATVYAGELFKDFDGRLTPGQEWRLVVSDANRNQLYVIHITSQMSQ